MSDRSADRDLLLNQLADEFAERYRRGERPSLGEYLDRYPELADDLRELLPALVEMEQAKEDQQDAEPAPAVPLPPLQQLGDFRILREVGHGGMGVVYEAEQVEAARRPRVSIPRGDRLPPTRQAGGGTPAAGRGHRSDGRRAEKGPGSHRGRLGERGPLLDSSATGRGAD